MHKENKDDESNIIFRDVILLALTGFIFMVVLIITFCYNLHMIALTQQFLLGML